MDFMHRIYDRSVYGTLDFASDIGGLFAALKAPFALVISVVNYWAAYQFVMAGNFVHRTAARKSKKSGVKNMDMLNEQT